jgi:hypothetical protein
MKKMICLAVCGLLATGLSVFAQMGGPPMPDMDRAQGLSRLFGDSGSFSATLNIKIEGGKSNGTEMTVAYAMSGAKSRSDIDFSKVKSPQLKPADIAQLKQVGMDKLVVISRPDKRTTYQVYPSMKGYLTMPMPAANPNARQPGVVKTELGTEAIDGRACKKTMVEITDPDGTKTTFTVWVPTTGDEFPLQVQSVDGAETTTTRFSDVTLAQPADSMFEVPADCQPYKNMMEMIMKKMTGGQ